MARRTKRGFTLVEVLIVVVIMAILAAAVIPQFTDSSTDAKASTGLMNLRTLRTQINMYKLEHGGKLPAADLGELLIQTNAAGTAGTDFGPYLQFIPDNPFTSSNKVGATTDDPPKAATGGDDDGWLYNATSGNIYLDHKDYLDK